MTIQDTKQPQPQPLQATTAPEKKPEIEDSEENEEVYEVETLLGHRLSSKKNNSIDYLIKWKNYEDDQNTWENESNIFCDDLVKIYWTSKKTTKKDFLREESNLKAKKGKRPRQRTSDTKGDKKRKPDTVAIKTFVSSDKHIANDNTSPVLKKQDTKDSESNLVTINIEPPTGMTWADGVQVQSVFGTEATELYAKVTWLAGQTTYCPNENMRKHRPDLLLEFYERHLEFSAYGSEEEKERV
ncbi:hypothetical protein BDF14DRAFT_1764296 [Spinellus fusiger]|nr:hypothetical protein BDF14DRAFT_1764296 [Spinellus fusiger]